MLAPEERNIARHLKRVSELLFETCHDIVQRSPLIIRTVSMLPLFVFNNNAGPGYRDLIAGNFH